MINLRYITENDVITKLKYHLSKSQVGSDEWRILSSALKFSEVFSFTENRTYPRPDHPDENKRKPLIFMLIAILISLRTTLENEQKAVINLIDRFPTEELLFNASTKEIEMCIKPAGMPKMKSERIRRALDYVLENYDGKIETIGTFKKEEIRDLVLEIPGVGPKSADCLLSIGFGVPSIAIDINVFRVTSWLFDLPWSAKPDYGNKDQVSQVKKILDEAIGYDAFLCQIVHTYFLLFGKKMKSKHPINGPCLAEEFCLTCKKNKQNQYTLLKVY